MTKIAHRTIQLVLIALYIPIGGFYYYYYNKSRESDDYRLQLWAELKKGSVTKQEYYRLGVGMIPKAATLFGLKWPPVSPKIGQLADFKRL
ncbi:hypothetical protein [Pedobacter miscanthi]|nr:hypothetical protein [Pedobacter miscanthi]